MTKDPHAPASHEDIRLLMEQMGHYYDSTNTRMTALEGTVAELRSDVAELKNDMTQMKSDVAELKSDMKEWKQEIIHEFKIVAEDLRHNLIGSTKDRMSSLEDVDARHDRRITRLEKHAGLAV